MPSVRFTHAVSPIDFKSNKIFEVVASSRRQTNPVHSSRISSLTASSANVLNTSPTVIYDHNTRDGNNITSCNQITDKSLFNLNGIPNSEVVGRFIDDLM